MLPYSTSLSLLRWTVTLLFVLSTDMRRIVVASSTSSSLPLSDVVNIVGSKDVGRTLDESLVGPDNDEHIQAITPKMQVCACQPSWYTLQLNRSLDCDDRTIFTGQTLGIESVVCTQPQDKTATALTAISTVTGRPYVPTLINTVIIKELNRQGHVLKQQTIHGPFPDGTEITYISILADAAATTSTTINKTATTTTTTTTTGNNSSTVQSATRSETTPSPSLQNDMDQVQVAAANDNNHSSSSSLGLPVRLQVQFLGYPGGSVWSMAYSQDCLGGPILQKGHKIIRAVLSDVGSPAVGFCPTSEATVLVPTNKDKKTAPSSSTRVATLPRRSSSTAIPMVFVLGSSTTNAVMTTAAAAATSLFQKLFYLQAQTARVRPVRDLIISTRHN